MLQETKGKNEEFEEAAENITEQDLELSQDFNFWSLMKYVFPSIFVFVFIRIVFLYIDMAGFNHIIPVILFKFPKIKT